MVILDGMDMPDKCEHCKYYLRTAACHLFDAHSCKLIVDNGRGEWAPSTEPLDCPLRGNYEEGDKK